MLQKIIETPITGAEASCHVLTSYTVDLVSNRCAVVVNSYYSDEARTAGRQAMHTWHIQLLGVPPAEAPSLQWFEQQLATEEVPAGNDPSYSIDPNRWVFAGAVIV